MCGRWERDVAHLFELTRRRFGETSPDPQAEAEHGWTLLGTDGRGNEDSGLTAAAVAETCRGDFAQLLADHPALRGVLRDDCRALMVHIRTEQRPYRDDAILYTPVWLYADADVAVEVREETRQYRRIEPLAPPVTLSSAGESLFERCGYDVRPTPRLWRRLFVACEAEAWLRRAEPSYPIRLLGGPLAGGAAELKVAIWRE